MAKFLIEKWPAMLDGQEQLLGMTPLSIAIALGDDSMTKLLLETGAKPDGCLNAQGAPCVVDIAQFSNLGNEALLLLYKAYLEVGGNEARIPAKTKSKPAALHPRSPLGPLRAATDKLSQSSVLHSLLERVGLPELSGTSPTSSYGTLAENAPGLCRQHSQFTCSTWFKPMAFCLADEIIRGNVRCPNPASKTASPHERIQLARDVVKGWLKFGDKLKPFPVGEPPWTIEKQRPNHTAMKGADHAYSGDRKKDSLMFYSTAQRIAYEPLLRPRVNSANKVQYVGKRRPKPLRMLANGTGSTEELPVQQLSSPAQLLTPHFTYSTASTEKLSGSFGPFLHLRQSANSCQNPLKSVQAKVPGITHLHLLGNGEALPATGRSGWQIPLSKSAASVVKRNAPSRPRYSENSSSSVVTKRNDYNRRRATSRSMDSTTTESQAFKSAPTTPAARQRGAPPRTAIANQNFASSTQDRRSMFAERSAGVETSSRTAAAPTRCYVHSHDRAITGPSRASNLAKGRSDGVLLNTRRRGDYQASTKASGQRDDQQKVYQRLAANIPEQYIQCFRKDEIDEEMLLALSEVDIVKIFTRHHIDCSDPGVMAAVRKIIRLCIEG